MKDEKKTLHILLIVAMVLSCILLVYNLRVLPSFSLPSIQYHVDSTSAKDGSSSAAVAPEQNKKINVNTATAVELERIPGIGTKTASYILAYIHEKGPVSSIDQLSEIYGIGDKTIEKLKQYLYAANP